MQASPPASVEVIIAGLAGVGYIAPAPHRAGAVHGAAPVQAPGSSVEGCVAGVGKIEPGHRHLTPCSNLPLDPHRSFATRAWTRSPSAVRVESTDKQLLYTQILEGPDGRGGGGGGGRSWRYTMEAAMDRLHGMGDMFFSRPVHGAPADPEGAAVGKRLRVLLIDEIDKSDERFEAFLLGVLAHRRSRPRSPRSAPSRPRSRRWCSSSSNNVRDLGDALKRRCLHLHIPLPDARLEERIVATRVPGVEAQLTRELVAFVQSLREIELRKVPSISETVDWARALVLLHADALSTDLVRETLNVLLKYEQDIVAIEPKLNELLGRASEVSGGE